MWGFASGSYADYVAPAEGDVGLKPDGLPFEEAGTLPEVGLTSLFSLKRTGSLPGTPMPTGSPWEKKNLTVVITAGSGGTGFIGIEIAKAYGAAHIATATTGANAIAFVKSLGATYVTDFMKQDIFDSLPGGYKHACCGCSCCARRVSDRQLLALCTPGSRVNAKSRT